MEYTFFQLANTGMDLGVIFEHLYDERGGKASTPFQDDWMTGVRLSFNDVQSTEMLVGLIVDRASGASFINLEASWRIGSNWKILLEARAFAGIPDNDPLFGLRKDSYLNFEIARYF